jgi:hypothetical protein
MESILLSWGIRGASATEHRVLETTEALIVRVA